MTILIGWLQWLAQVVAFKWSFIPIVLFIMFMGEDWKHFLRTKYIHKMKEIQYQYPQFGY
jgi:hypothetical protein